MKLNFLFLLLSLTVFTFSACDDDDNDIVQDSLNYDGPNFTAPFNTPGTTTFAAFFPESEVQEFTGRRLERISFWLQSVPTATEVIVFAEGADTRTPGEELYAIDLTQRVRTTGWVDHIIPGGIELDGRGIWLAVAAEAPEARFQMMGCDEGRNYNPNGDRMLPPGGVWTSFNEITGSERINWNIRGFLADE